MSFQPAPDAEGLRAKARHASALAQQRRRETLSFAAAGQLWQVEALTTLLAGATDRRWAHVLDQMPLVLGDLDQLLHALDVKQGVSFSSRDANTAHQLSERLLPAAGLLMLDEPPPSDLLETTPPGMSSTERKGSLRCLVAAYHDDAQRHRRSARILCAVATAGLLGAVAIAIVGVRGAAAKAGFDASEALSYFGVATICLLGTTAFAYAARRQRLAEFEATRLQRQIFSLDALLLPMAPALQDMMRATIFRQFFPRLPEYSEPWLEAAWPDADKLMEAIQFKRT